MAPALLSALLLINVQFFISLLLPNAEDNAPPLFFA